MADAYQPNLGAGGSPAFRGATADEAGAAIGQGLQYAGEKDRPGDPPAARARSRSASGRRRVCSSRRSRPRSIKAAIDARNDAAPGAAGHADAISKAIDDKTAEALGNIKDPRIRARFAENYAQLKDRVATREYGWETATRVNYMAQNVDDTGTTLANGQATNPDAVGLEASLNTVHTSIDAMEGSRST
jgi:hypothetical protein